MLDILSKIKVANLRLFKIIGKKNKQKRKGHTENVAFIF